MLPSAYAMLALVTYIAGSPLSQGIFGWTSLWELHIAQTKPTWPYNGPYLCISPRTDGMVEFRYIDTAEKSKQWDRIAAPDEVIQ